METLKRTLALILVATLPLVACSNEKKAAPAKASCTDCTEDEICVQGACSPRGTVEVEAEIGSKKGQLGVSVAEEAAALAPASLAVNSVGEVWILDQENQRLELFEGKSLEQVVELDANTYRDLVLLGEDRIVLMDNLVAKKLVVLDLDGKVIDSVPLFGPELDEPQLVSGMESRTDGVWVRYRGRMIRVLTAKGKADPERPMVYGHLSVDGEDVISIETRGTLLQLFKRRRTGPLEATTVTHELERPITNIGEMHSDAAGGLYMICNHYGDEADPERRLLVFDGKLKLVRSTAIPVEKGSGSAEVFRMMDVTAAGDVYLLRVGKSDVKVRRF